MGLPLPQTLSPSKVSTFKDCALAFRFSAIDRLPEAPSVPASRGTLVHSALERLFDFQRPARERTLAAGLTALTEAYEQFRAHPDFVDLALDADQEAAFLDEAEQLVRRYFELEDPQAVDPVGLELGLSIPFNGLRLRGIIDRLELDADGELVVTDYKTGRVPSEATEQARLGGVQFYSLLCERFFGRRPARVQLLYLKEPTAIIATPTEQSTRALERKVQAIWSAIERACERDSFKPRTSKLCDWCAFKPFCPAWGGDPDQARELVPLGREIPGQEVLVGS
jgi:putative RecB family exonuclease